MKTIIIITISFIIGFIIGYIISSIKHFTPDDEYNDYLNN